MKHICDDKECIFFGQPTANTCGCHKTADEMLSAENVRLRSALANIMNWLEGSEGTEQIPPRYLTAANEALKQ